MKRNATTLKFAVALALVTAATGAANADDGTCPDWRYDARSEITGSAEQFYQRHSYAAVAGGYTQLDYCDVSYMTPERATGFVSREPDFELYYDGNSNYTLELSVSSACD
ncbi:MAG: hypothetical protein ACC631_06000, partial [Halocynthiibacter sp.]